jgi:hypothetical protein
MDEIEAAPVLFMELFGTEFTHNWRICDYPEGR